MSVTLILEHGTRRLRPLTRSQVGVLDPKRKRTGTIAAGEFARWLREYLRSQTQAESAGDVPCGDCNACCSASYFVSIQADERETISRIPHERLTKSSRPDEPEWTLDQNCGRCPMLVGGSCSIYAHRPRTCRRFDCRVFAATGVGLGSGPRARVNERIWQWRFEYPSALDAECQSAVLAAVAFLQRRPDLIHPDVAPADPGELAKAAVFVHDIFLESNESSAALAAHSDENLAAAINQKLRQLSEASMRAPRRH